MVSTWIKQLTEYGISRNLITWEDAVYTRNMLLLELHEDSYEEPGDVPEIKSPEDLEEVLRNINNYAVKKGLITEDSVVFRDLFDTRIMNTLLPKPGQVIRIFREKYKISPKEATDFYYTFSKNSDYIRTYRIKKDRKWTVDTPYGTMDITINLSKPEKDPRAIARAKLAAPSSYPKCQLCMENEGYAGRADHPARENHRIIPILIRGQKWGFQYSPYVYYNEHCIVFNGEHVPMQINRETFEKMFDFLDLFPHYFVGSNADLPIVGGSILSHDHFQGGNYTFAMAKAPVEYEIHFDGYEEVQAGIVKWPMSVIRLRGKDRRKIAELAEKILCVWRVYTDSSVSIYAETNGEPHNTITPIARMQKDRYELDLVLRNNITTEEHPLGLFHPWEEFHHIKKENIGLIEVMGLAVLPARLKKELAELADAMVRGADIRADERIAAHADWVESLMEKYPEIDESNIMNILEKEVGLIFCQILECAGVYKRTPEGRKAFLRFIETVNKR